MYVLFDIPTFFLLFFFHLFHFIHSDLLFRKGASFYFGNCHGVYYFVSWGHFYKRCVSSLRSTEEHFQDKIYSGILCNFMG